MKQSIEGFWESKNLKKIIICYVSFNYYPGQGSTAFYEFSKNVKKTGQKVYVISAARNGEKKYEIVDGVEVFRIPIKTIKRRSLDNLRFTFYASKIINHLIEHNKLEIVHFFSYAFNSLVKLWTYPAGKKVKWIYDVRSGPILSNIGYSLSKKLMCFEATFFNELFFIDENVKKEIFGSFWKNAKVTIVPTGVDLDLFKLRKKESKTIKKKFSEKDISLIYLGSLNVERQIQNLFLAFWLTQKKIPNLRMILIGHGDDMFRLTTYVDKLSISDKIHFLGYINYTEIPYYLTMADIAISYVPITPAFYAQPPTKTMEYLACSLPVIGTNTQGNQVFITHEVNGLLVEDNPVMLSNAIERLYLDETLRNKLSNNARKSVLEYDWNKIILEILLPAYREMIND